MKWSWRIARLFGIDVYIHITFLILLGWFALVPLFQGYNTTVALRQVLFIIALFGIVVLHELGHALTARRFGIQTRDIVLLPIGGVARLERMPENPKQELLVALAGPAVNLVLAAALFGVFVPLTDLADMAQFQTLAIAGERLAAKLIVFNLTLAVFNLIPAFPMDGGRVLRALLALRMEYVQATQIAATIGQGVALLFGFFGLFSSPFLLFIALFVWMGAAEESSMVQMKSALGGIPISRAMITSFYALSPTDTLERAVQYVVAGFQQDFPVLDQGRLVGVLTRADLMTALAKSGQTSRVSDAMQREFETADPSEMLDGVFARLQSCECRTLPVVRAGELVGMVTLENLGELLMVQSALRRKGPRRNV